LRQCPSEDLRFTVKIKASGTEREERLHRGMDREGKTESKRAERERACLSPLSIYSIVFIADDRFES